MTLNLTPAREALDALQADHLAQVQAASAANDAEVADLKSKIATLEARPKPLVHLVQSGDTLTSISRAYGPTVEQIKDWNDLTSDTIVVNDVLFLIDGHDEPDVEPEPTPAGQFPGDPGPGKFLVGVASSGQSIDRVREREKYIGMKMGFRQFLNGGISDLAVPNGPFAADVKRDLAEKRIPIESCKPGIEALAAHRFEAELVAFFKWYQAELVRLDEYGVFIDHHEPGNDWLADNNNLPVMAKHHADWAEAQRWVRRCMNKAVKRSESRIIFVGALMTYEWSAIGIKQWGHPDQMDPGMDPENPSQHVLDLLCGDHYAPKLDASTLENSQLSGLVASGKKWKVGIGLTELGVRQGNPNGGKVLKALLDKAGPEGYNFRLVVYWDSNAGKGGQPQPDLDQQWVLNEANGTLQVWKAWCLANGVNPNAPA